MIVRVHNISDRPNTPGGAVAVLIGGTKLRPGQHLVLNDNALNQKHYSLHGTVLWIGDLPARYVRTSRAGRAPAEVEVVELSQALTLEQVRAHLATCTSEEMLAMAQQAMPPIDLRPTASKPALIARLSRALFHDGRELDPETFFWLGRWKREHGAFVPME